MRVFLYTMFVGSWIGITACVLVLTAAKEWPHTVRWAKWEYAVRLLMAIGFMLWEAMLLWR